MVFIFILGSRNLMDSSIDFAKVFEILTNICKLDQTTSTVLMHQSRVTFLQVETFMKIDNICIICHHLVKCQQACLSFCHVVSILIYQLSMQVLSTQ